MSNARSHVRRQPVNVTGRDGYIIRQALAYAHLSILALPPRWREWSNAQDMLAILKAAAGEAEADRVILGARSHLEQRGLTVDATNKLVLAERPGGQVVPLHS